MLLTIWNFVLSKLTTGGNQAVSWPQVIATRYVSFATTLNTRYLQKKLISNTDSTNGKTLSYS